MLPDEASKPRFIYTIYINTTEVVFFVGGWSTEQVGSNVQGQRSIKVNQSNSIKKTAQRRPKFHPIFWDDISYPVFFRDYFINHDIRTPIINQPGWPMESSKVVFFRGSNDNFPTLWQVTILETNSGDQPASPKELVLKRPLVEFFGSAAERISAISTPCSSKKWPPVTERTPKIKMLKLRWWFLPWKKDDFPFQS